MVDKWLGFRVQSLGFIMEIVNQYMQILITDYRLLITWGDEWLGFSNYISGGTLPVPKKAWIPSVRCTNVLVYGRGDTGTRGHGDAGKL
jgi:hypothetical protein